MLEKRTVVLRSTVATGVLLAFTACTPDPIKVCSLEVEDLTTQLIADIRSDPEFDRKLLVWLELCPEIALAIADQATASITARPAFLGSDGDNEGDDGSGGFTPPGRDGDDGDDGDEGSGGNEGSDVFTPPGHDGAAPNTNGNDTPGHGGTPPGKLRK